MQTDPHSVFDLLIVGGGLVGNSLALALTDHAKIALIEANSSDPPANKDERALALSFASQRIFTALGIWDKIQSHSTPIQQIHVSAVGHFGITRFLAADYALPALGYVVNAQLLADQLRHSVSQKSAIRRYYSTTLQQITPCPEGYRVQVQTANGIQTLTTRLLIGADGIESYTRKLLGVEADRQQYAQMAFTAQLTLTHPHHYTAYERFSAQAVLATLPLAENRVGIVWTVANEQAKSLAILSEADFCQQFQAAFGYRLGQFTPAGPRQAYALGSLHAKQQIRPHAVLLGNAAHTLHPVAAQGFNLSLRDVAALAQTVMDALTAGKNPGELVILEKYLTSRHKQQLEIRGFTHSIVRVFSQQTFPWTLLKETGLLGLELLPVVKHAFARHAMGIADPLPKWVTLASFHG